MLKNKLRNSLFALKRRKDEQRQLPYMRLKAKAFVSLYKNMTKRKKLAEKVFSSFCTYLEGDKRLAFSKLRFNGSKLQNFILGGSQSNIYHEYNNMNNEDNLIDLDTINERRTNARNQNLKKTVKKPRKKKKGEKMGKSEIDRIFNEQNKKMEKIRKIKKGVKWVRYA